MARSRFFINHWQPRFGNDGGMQVFSGVSRSVFVAPQKAHKSRAGVKYPALEGSRNYSPKVTKLPSRHPFELEIELASKRKYFQKHGTRYRQERFLVAQ